MAKVTARKETGRLVIDFTHRAVRCREQTALDDTVANRRRLQPVVDRIKKAIGDGSFRYADFFPNSPQCARFDEAAHGVSQEIAPTPASADRPETPSFRIFADQWLTNHAVEWRRSHVRVLRSTIDGHLVKHFGDKPIGEITKSDLLAFRNVLAETPGRHGEGLSAKRINGILAPLKQMLAEAAEMYGFTSPAINIKPLRIRKSDVQPFTLAEAQNIIGTCRPDYRHYFITRFFTGMRTGEVHGLKWKYVDFEHRLILIRETFVLGEDEYTKTDSSQRDIQMSQVVYEALRHQHAATSKVSEYVFCNREGLPLDNKNFSERVWYPLLRHLGLAKRRPYQMRHTAATLWLASGEAPEWIARQLGHSSTEMLFRVYSRFVPNLTRRDGSAIDRLLASRFAGISETPPGAPQLPPPDERPPPANSVAWALAA